MTCSTCIAALLAATALAAPPRAAPLTAHLKVAEPCAFRVARDLSLHFEHHLGAAAARKRVETKLRSLQAKFAGSLSSSSIVWAGDSAHVRVAVFGQEAQALVQVNASSVDVTAHLPLILSPLAGNITSVLQQAADETLR